MTLDEIYESFFWDESYTDDEYEAKIAVGINEARKYKYLSVYSALYTRIAIQECLGSVCQSDSTKKR